MTVIVIECLERQLIPRTNYSEPADLSNDCLAQRALTTQLIAIEACFAAFFCFRRTSMMHYSRSNLAHLLTSAQPANYNLVTTTKDPLLDFSNDYPKPKKTQSTHHLQIAAFSQEIFIEIQLTPFGAISQTEQKEGTTRSHK